MGRKLIKILEEKPATRKPSDQLRNSYIGGTCKTNGATMYVHISQTINGHVFITST